MNESEIIKTIDEMIAKLQADRVILVASIEALTKAAKDLANAAMEYAEAVDAEMESGDYHINDFDKTDEELDEHNDNVNAAVCAFKKMKKLADAVDKI